MVLTNAEVALLLEKIIQQKSEQPEHASNTANLEKIRQVKSYVDRFVGTTNTDIANQVRK